MADLDLDAILAAARAARDEVASGRWTPSPPFLRHRSDAPDDMLRDVLASTRPRVAVAEDCSDIVAAHIASVDPDTVIALVERLRAAEVERDRLQRLVHLIAEDIVTAPRSLTDALSSLRRAVNEREAARLAAQRLRAENGTLRRHRDLAEIHCTRLSGLTDVMLGVIERAGARHRDDEAQVQQLRSDLAIANATDDRHELVARSHYEEREEIRAALDVQVDLAVTLLESNHEWRRLLWHVHAELVRISVDALNERMALLALQIDVALGGAEPQPEVDGEQHETFDATLPKSGQRSTR